MSIFVLVLGVSLLPLAGLLAGIWIGATWNRRLPSCRPGETVHFTDGRCYVEQVVSDSHDGLTVVLRRERGTR